VATRARFGQFGRDDRKMSFFRTDWRRRWRDVGRRLIRPGRRGASSSAAAPAWTPAQATTSGGVLPHTWHYADSGAIYQDAGITPVASDGDVVGRSVNQGSDSHNANQTTTSLKPTWQTSELNGRPVFRIDGIDDFLAGTFTGALTQPFTQIVVAKLTLAAVNDNSQHTAIDGAGTLNMAIKTATATDPDTWQINAGTGANGSATNANWNIFTALFNAVSSRLWINGISDIAAAAGSENPTGITIGATIGGTNVWAGDIAEILIYNSSLSDADKNEIGDYLAAKYGLTYTDI
jgi:hypothetical protein